MCKIMNGKKVLLHANHGEPNWVAGTHCSVALVEGLFKIYVLWSINAGVMIATETIAEAWDYM